MIQLLRAISLFNAALWFGGAVFFTFGVAPGFFSASMEQLLPEAYRGLAAQIILERYFYLHYLCGCLALAHLLIEWLYLGRAVSRWMLGIVGGLLVIGLLGGLWIQPKLKQLYRIKSARAGVYSLEAQATASASFRRWHGASQGLNLLLLVGLGAYLWRTANAAETPRFVSAKKFRS